MISLNDDIIEDPREIKNPFLGYELKIREGGKYQINPVHELVDAYHKMKGTDKMPKEFYVGKNNYAKLASEAKLLYKVLNEKFDDCMWAMDKMKYLADKNGFNWSISTCLKHKKL